jgi:transcriptional regulator with XRE-family HTH domain
MSQGKLASRLGLKSASFISMLETGRSPVPLDKLRSVCEILELPEAWFWERMLAPRAKGDGGHFHAWLFGPDGRLRGRCEAGLEQARMSVAPGKT